MQKRIEPLAEKKAARYFFESVADMQSFIDTNAPTWKGAGLDCSQSNPKSPDWDLEAGYEGAATMAREGWNEGAQRAQIALKDLRLNTPQPQTRTDVYGFRPHVARFCAGAPDSMIRHSENAPDGRRAVLTLIVPINAAERVPASAMANFGVAIAQYVNQAETNGTRVEVIAAMTSLVSRWRVCTSVRIKYADQPLDLATMAFAIGHPAMFRRLGFAMRERSAAPADTAYGYTVPTRLDDVINAPLGAVILNGMADADTHARTPANGLAYVTRTIDAAIAAQEKGE